MNPSQPPPTTMEFAAFVALDWADQKHVWALQVAGEARVQHGELENTPEAVQVWASELEQRFGGRPIAVALEQPRGAVVAMLSKYAHLVLFPVHPNTLAHYRQSFYPSGAKSDPSDADLLLELLVQHPDRLRSLQPDTVETRLLQFLVEERRRLVDDKTRDSNRLTAYLKQPDPATRYGGTRLASPPGTYWTAEIEQAIDAADIVLTILSKAFYLSDVYHAEHSCAPSAREKRLLPLLLQPKLTAPPPSRPPCSPRTTEPPRARRRSPPLRHPPGRLHPTVQPHLDMAG